MYNTRNSSRTSSKIRIGDTEAFVLSSDDSEVENFKTKYISNYLNTNDKGPSSGNIAHPQSSSRIVKRGNRGKLEGILKLPLDLELEVYLFIIDHVVCAKERVCNYRYTAILNHLTFFDFLEHLKTCVSFLCPEVMPLSGVQHARTFLTSLLFRLIFRNLSMRIWCLLPIATYDLHYSYY